MGEVLAYPASGLGDLRHRCADLGEPGIELKGLEDRRAEPSGRGDNALSGEQRLTDETSKVSPDDGVDMS